MVENVLLDKAGLRRLNRYDVSSREDCFDAQLLDIHLDREIRDKFQPKHFFGNYKKDLRVIYYGLKNIMTCLNKPLRTFLFFCLIMQEMKSSWKT
ncbi:MAG: hypothetical protein U5L00_20655 [Desulfovermiculus sp.]|nr:hypothetical protein [Desulfovermiculus sp.]